MAKRDEPNRIKTGEATPERKLMNRRVNDDHLDAPWRNTPLDNWSKDIDPYIMSGDKYVDNDHDLGTTRRENLEILNGNFSPVAAPFMHPTHDVSMRNNEDNV